MKDIFKQDKDDMTKVAEFNRDIPVEKKCAKLLEKQYSATDIKTSTVHSQGKITVFREQLGEEGDSV